MTDQQPPVAVVLLPDRVVMRREGDYFVIEASWEAMPGQPRTFRVRAELVAAIVPQILALRPPAPTPAPGQGDGAR